MIAQIDIEPWHVYTTAIVIIGGSLVKWWVTVHNAKAKEKREQEKEKHEQERERQKAQREEARDNEHTKFLSRIADTNERMVASVTTLNERLLAERDLHRLMHEENLRKFDTTCKFK
jgi:hypothetical protein